MYDLRFHPCGQESWRPLGRRAPNTLQTLLTLILASLLGASCSDGLSDDAALLTSPESTNVLGQASTVDSISAEREFQKLMSGTYDYEAGRCVFVYPDTDLQSGFQCGVILVGVQPSVSQAQIDEFASSINGRVSVVIGRSPWRSVVISVDVGSERAALEEAYDNAITIWVSLNISSPVVLF